MLSEGEQTVLAIIIFIYFIFLASLSLYMNRKTKTYEDYNVAGRSVSLFPLILTFVGTGVGGATLLGYMENGYESGMGEQWIHMTMLISVILFLFFLLKRIRHLGEKHNMVTIGDYAALRYGQHARIPTVISFLFSYCAMTGMQFVAIATILNLTIGLNLTLGILIGWVLLTLKTYFGGLKAIIWQDVIHGLMLIAGMILLFFSVLTAAGGWGAVSAYASSVNQENMLAISNIKPSEVLVYLLTLGFYQFIRQDLWQRIWAAKSLKTAVNGYWISMLIAVIIGVATVAIGVVGRYGLKLKNVDPEFIYYSVINHVFPSSVVIVMIFVLLAAVISSADSFFIAGSSSIVNDIIKPNVNRLDNRKMLHYSRSSVLIVSVVALVLALTVPGLVNLMVTGTAMTVSSLLAPIILGLFWRRVPNVAGVVSMWGGLSIAVIWQLLAHPFDLHPVFIGVLLSIVLLFIVTFSTKQTNQSHPSHIEMNAK